MTIETNQPTDRINPYTGPRAFKYGENLYGREAEVADLRDLLISERIVLLHSPSGAGKTSLIQAALIPELEQNEFTVLPILRVGLGLPQDWGATPGINRYVASVVQSLETVLAVNWQNSLSELAGQTLQQIFSKLRPEGEDPGFEVLIFDQFEEIFTVDPTDRIAKQDFFTQLGELLRDRRRWVLFAMREEYIAALSPYLRTLPTRLRTQFRIELLGEDSARRAIQSPAEAQGVDFETAAANALVDDLRKVQVQGPDGTTQWKLGSYVEPVQLQVICRRLWEKRREKNRITEKDIGESGDVNAALAGYYADSVAEVAVKTGVDERQIRSWVEAELITKEGIRSRILKGPDNSQGLDNRSIQELVNTHLVRVEESHYRTWFELAHDRLVDPVRGDNAAWREVNLKSWQRQAELWWQQGEPKRLLLDEQLLQEAELWMVGEMSEPANTEVRFIQASSEELIRIKKERKQRSRIRFLSISTASSLFLVFILISVYAYDQWEPWGYFQNLATGKISLLRKAQITFGRSTEFQNTINVPTNFVSRMHLVATQDFEVFDSRSLNGSTINAKFIEYGEVGQLSSGDIIALAGTAAFRFEPIDFAPLKVLKITDGEPISARLLFIDGLNRKVIPLTKQQYFLSIDNHEQVLLSQEKKTGTLLKIETDEQGYVLVFDEKDSSDLSFKFKADDYIYPMVKIPPSESFSVYRIPWKDRDGIDREGSYSPLSGVFRYEREGLSFQFVRIGL